MNMIKHEHRATVAHHSMAMVGGFFGVYALLNRGDTFGSSATANLIYLFVAGLSGSRQEFTIRLGAAAVYISGIIFATWIFRYFKERDFRYLSVAVDIIACLILAQIPADTDSVLALYPMFFAAAVQWLAYTNASGYNSATVFSTNNTRQCFAGLTEYLCDHDPAQLARFRFFGGTLLCFHAGVVYCWFCMRAWELKSIYACIPLLVWVGIAAWLDRRGGHKVEEHVHRDRAKYELT
ncbi:MAG: DUF1275 domain-containing protein [Lachnospiraceae bacterium]|nr:DUF1275 domain-containing protein [Lachnospiraceae bacterium]